MNIEFAKLAKVDYDEARTYYSSIDSKVVARFQSDISASIERIINFPTLYPNVNARVKKCVAAKFPFTVFYTLKEDVIVILAIANHHKNPKSYLGRFS